MYLGNFKVQIQETPGRITSRIFLFLPREGTTTFFTHKGTGVEVKEGEAPNYDELYFAEMSPDQLQAFAEALADKGIKTNKDSIAEGKLAATEKHLEDMRTIALHRFKKEESNE